LFEPVVPEVARLGVVFVNVFALGEPRGPWVLVDTGLLGSAGGSGRARGPRRYCCPTATSTMPARHTNSPAVGGSPLRPPARDPVPHRRVGLPAARPDHGRRDGADVPPNARPWLRLRRPGARPPRGGTALTAAINFRGNSQPSPVDANPDANLGEHRQTCTTSSSKYCAYFQLYLNISERPRHHHLAFARRRSGVRIPSAPLLGLNTGQSQVGTHPPEGHTRLHHFAIVYPDRREKAHSVLEVLKSL
jgi:hypothetical protein